MKAPEIPANEQERLKELRSLNILDTAPEDRFDRITRLAQRLFGVSTAIVTLVDENRNWFKSRIGFGDDESPREISFCGHAILHDDIMTIADATQDDRFSDNPYVIGNPDYRFYAGCPIVGPGGAKLGTLCILDQTPRELSAEELSSLRDLAEMVEDEIATNTLAVTDPLTGLGNRRGFEMAASAVLEINRRRCAGTALLFFDLDKFKLINDNYGHAEGDRALQEFAALLHNVFRISDVIARLGGDEFVVLLSETRDHETAVHRLERALEEKNNGQEHEYVLQTSIGVAMKSWGDDETLESLLQRADEDMYRHKRAK